MEQEISLLVKHREPLNRHGELRETIEHVNDHSEEQSPSVQRTILLIPGESMQKAMRER